MDFIEIRSFDNYIEANIVMNMLLHSHINCHLKDEHIITIDPLLSPALGGIKLMVHQSQIERAWNLMDEAEKKYLQTIHCPVCKAKTISKKMISKKPSTKLGILANLLLSGRCMHITYIFECRTCGYDFKQLPAY